MLWPEHRGGVEDLAPCAGEQVGGLEEDRGPILETPVGPVALGLDRGVHRGPDRRGVGLVGPGQDPRVAVRAGRRRGCRRCRRCRPPTTTGNLRLLGPHAAERGLEGRPLGGAGRVAEDGLVARTGNVEDAAHRSIRSGEGGN